MNSAVPPGWFEHLATVVRPSQVSPYGQFIVPDDVLVRALA